MANASIKELVSHQLKQTTSLFGEVLYSENDDNQCIFCRSFHSGQCNSLAYSVKINSVEDQLLLTRFKSIWEKFPRSKKYAISSEGIEMKVNSVSLSPELAKFLLTLDEQVRFRTYLDEDTFSYIGKLKSGENVQVASGGEDIFNDFIEEIIMACTRDGLQESASLVHQMKKLQKKVLKSIERGEKSKADASSFSSIIHLDTQPIISPEQLDRDILKGLEPVDSPDFRASSSTPNSVESQLLLDISPQVSVQASPASKRSAEEESAGLKIAKRSRSKASGTSSFLGAEHLHSITFPCHDNAEYVLGYKPEISPRKNGKATQGARAPKAGKARGYAKAIFAEGDENVYSSVYFRYCSEQRKGVIEDLMLRAQGCGGVELINPPCDMNEDDLILWAKTWSQQVKQWAVRFAEDSSATITQLAIKWGQHVIDAKNEALTEERERKDVLENNCKSLRAAISSLNF